MPAAAWAKPVEVGASSSETTTAATVTEAATTRVARVYTISLRIGAPSVELVRSAVGAEPPRGMLTW